MFLLYIQTTSPACNYGQWREREYILRTPIACFPWPKYSRAGRVARCILIIIIVTNMPHILPNVHHRHWCAASLSSVCVRRVRPCHHQLCISWTVMSAFVTLFCMRPKSSRPSDGATASSLRQFHDASLYMYMLCTNAYYIDSTDSSSSLLTSNILYINIQTKAHKHISRWRVRNDLDTHAQCTHSTCLCVSSIFPSSAANNACVRRVSSIEASVFPSLR